MTGKLNGEIASDINAILNQFPFLNLAECRHIKTDPNFSGISYANILFSIFTNQGFSRIYIPGNGSILVPTVEVDMYVYDATQLPY